MDGRTLKMVSAIDEPGCGCRRWGEAFGPLTLEEAVGHVLTRPRSGIVRDAGVSAPTYLSGRRRLARDDEPLGASLKQDENAAARQGRDVPGVLDLPDAAKLLGIGRTFAYQLVREGRWPTPVLRVGRLIKIPARPLLDLISESRKTA